MKIRKISNGDDYEQYMPIIAGLRDLLIYCSLVVVGGDWCSSTKINQVEEDMSESFVCFMMVVKTKFKFETFSLAMMIIKHHHTR